MVDRKNRTRDADCVGLSASLVLRRSVSCWVSSRVCHHTFGGFEQPDLCVVRLPHSGQGLGGM